MGEVQNVTEVAKGISDFGMMVIIGSCFIVLSIGMWIAIFNWFRSIINNIIQQQDDMRPVIEGIRENGNILKVIAEEMRPATLLQVKSISNTCFDLAIERVCRIIKKVREENHIKDKEATRAKIRTLISNLHDDRNSRFDTTKYGGKTLTQYTSEEWIEWVSEVVEREVYAEEANNGRAYTNVEAVYARIRLDFYHRLTE